MWKQWINLLLGLAVVLFAYLGGGHTRYIITGLVIAALSLWAALEKKA